MNSLVQGVVEVQEEIISEERLLNIVRQGKAIILKGRGRNVAIGKNLLVKVNTNIGISRQSGASEGFRQLDTLCNVKYRPDTVMDHTIVHLAKPLWKHMLEKSDGPVGALPHYLTFKKSKGIDELELIERLHEMAEGGISFMTLHPTPSHELYKVAKSSRTTPTPSRGGGIVIKDMMMNTRDENVLEKNFDKILEICKTHSVVVSIGGAFRPSNIHQALDGAHLEEMHRQQEFISRAKKAGVGVMMEGIGHLKLSDIEAYSQLIDKFEVPFMPLGPIPTDSAIGFDHVASAIGAAFLGMRGCAQIINSITREEHTGGVPSTESIIEGLKAARVAAHCVNVAHFPNIAKLDELVSKLREDNKTCVVSGGLFGNLLEGPYEKGCDRCRFECPLD